MDEQDDQGNRILLSGLDDFQRHLGGQLSITLLQQIGSALEAHSMDKDLLARAIAHLQNSSITCD